MTSKKFELNDFPKMERLVDRFGKPLVEEAGMFIARAQFPNGAPMCLDPTADAIEGILFASG